tara:strand:- start:6127 stop:7050 length:924 start_codon:yes stop_codon:yes gene_type:complete
MMGVHKALLSDKNSAGSIFAAEHGVIFQGVFVRELTVDEYVNALSSLLNKTGVKVEAGFAMLKAHYYEPNRLISATKLAKAAGRDKYNTGNEWYGSFSRKIAELLNFEPLLNDDKDLRWTYTICDASSSRDENNHFQWILKSEVASALEQLGIVEKRYYADALTDIDSKKEFISNLLDKYKERYVKARLGQGQFRSWSINHWKGCSLSGCTKIELLIASHIKPWRDCDTNEAIDPMNSLLLMPNYDALFDKGFITFCDRGKIKLSPHLDETTAKIFGINPNMALRETCRGHIPFLTYHRENVFRSKI